MTIFSDQDVYILIKHLYSASENKLSIQEQNKLYTVMNKAVVHLKGIDDFERISNIRKELLQKFNQYDPESHEMLKNWLCKHSINMPHGKTFGPIIPFIKLLKVCEKLKISGASDCDTLSLTSKKNDLPFSPLKYFEKSYDQIRPRFNLKQKVTNIINIFHLWRRIATVKDNGEKNASTSAKKHVFDETQRFINLLENEFLGYSRNDLNLIMFQQSKTFNKYPWSEIATWVAENSFSEFDGAFVLLDHFMHLIFGIHPLPENYKQARNSSLEQINKSKQNGINFSKIFNLKDLRKTYFNECEVLKTILQVSKKEEKVALEDLVAHINEGTISNHSLNLFSIEALLKYFGEENCKQLTRLQFDNTRDNPFTNLLIEDVFKYFPALKHLSLCNLDSINEQSLKHLNTLESLKIHGITESTIVDFLPKIKSLTEFEIKNSQVLNLENFLKLPKLKSLKFIVYDNKNLEIIPKLTALENLDVSINKIDTSFLQNLIKIKHLKVRGFFEILHLSSLPDLLSLNVESSCLVKNIKLCDFPSLKTLSLKETVADNLIINNVPEIVELDLGYTTFDINGLENSTMLSRLMAEHANISSNIDWMLKFPLKFLSLSILKIDNLKKLTTLSHLRELNLLRCLNVPNNYLEGLLECPSLKTLTIDKFLSQEMCEKFKARDIDIKLKSPCFSHNFFFHNPL